MLASVTALVALALAAFAAPITENSFKSGPGRCLVFTDASTTPTSTLDFVPSLHACNAVCSALSAPFYAAIKTADGASCYCLENTYKAQVSFDCPACNDLGSYAYCGAERDERLNLFVYRTVAEY